MEKEIWKWIFDHMFDEELIRLTRVARIRLDGFRDINTKMIRMVKPKLIQSFLQEKNLKKLRKTIYMSLSTDEDEQKLSKKELMNEIFHDYLSIVHLLLRFLSSDHQEEYQRGIELYYEFKEKGYLQACEQKFSLIKAQNDSLNQLEKVSNDYAELQKSYQSLLKTSETQYEEIKQLKLNNTQLQQEIERLKKTISEKQARVDRLIEQTTPKICIIGKITNDELSEIADDFRITIIEDTDQISIEKLNNYHEIWMLTYDIPFPTRRKIKQELPDKEVKRFDTYTEIKNHIKTISKGCQKHA